MPQKNQYRKIIVYSHDTYGLGNIRRMLVIAKALIDSDPDVSVLILSGSPMLHAFRISPRIDYIKLPCLTRTLNGTYQAKSLEMDFQEILNLRSNLIQSSILDFDPDLILVDKKPFGVADELLQALDELKRREHRAKMVLLLRDILDSPENTIRIWQKNGYHRAIRSFYDQVLVVGSPEIFDMRKEYQFPYHSQEKVKYCGYIAREGGRASRHQIRQLHGLNDERLVLVTPGGGEDGFQLLQCYLSGWQECGGMQNTKSLIICGPEMKEDQRDRINALVEASSNLIMKNFTDDMMACMNASDLVICMGGYNTICELLTLKKKAIVVPRTHPVQEQWIRAERMADLGLMRVIHPRLLTPGALMASVRAELNENAPRENNGFQINLNGLQGVCDSISQLLENVVPIHGPFFPDPDIDRTTSRTKAKVDLRLGLGQI